MSRRRTRLLAGILALVAAAFSFGEGVAASMCAPMSMEMAMPDMATTGHGSAGDAPRPTWS
tara:strand:- start:7 stop:189 length:183 start_codon:yes stop_codon:yes gene_type:complete